MTGSPEPSQTGTILAAALTFVLAAAIAVLTLMPMPEMGPPGSDKLHHILAFAALALPLALALPARRVAVFFGAVAYGGAIELIQPSFHRMGEWGDLGADAIGAALGVGIGVLVGIRMHRSD